MSRKNRSEPVEDTLELLDIVADRPGTTRACGGVER
jgi:hypothetical protein